MSSVFTQMSKHSESLKKTNKSKNGSERRDELNKQIKRTVKTVYFIPMNCDFDLPALPVVATIPVAEPNKHLLGIPSILNYPANHFIDYDDSLYLHHRSNVGVYLPLVRNIAPNEGKVLAGRSGLRKIFELLNGNTVHSAKLHVFEEGEIICINDTSLCEETKRGFGFNFERIMTGNGPVNHETFFSQVVNMDVPLFTESSHTLPLPNENMKLFVSCETDCLDADGHPVELKTVINGAPPHHAEKYFQILLAGVDRLIIGHVDNHEHPPVFELEEHSLDSLENEAFYGDHGVPLRLFHSFSRILSCLVRNYRNCHVKITCNLDENRLEIHEVTQTSLQDQVDEDGFKTVKPLAPELKFKEMK